MADKKNLMPKKLAIRRPNAKPVPLTPKPKSLGAERKIAPAPKGAQRKPTTPAVPQKTLRGPAAIKELQRQVSPKGIKKTESGAKKAIDKKYPGLYKK